MKKTLILRTGILIGAAALLFSLAGCASTASEQDASKPAISQTTVDEHAQHEAAKAGSTTATPAIAASEASAHHPADSSSKPEMEGMVIPDKSMMMANMEEMKVLMAKIRAIKDPAERKILMSEHHAMMKKHMMMMEHMDMKMMEMMKDGKCPMMQMMSAGKDNKSMMDMTPMCSQMMQDKAAMSHAMMEQMLDAQEQLLKMAQ